MEKGFVEIPLSSCVECDWNYKTDNEELVEKLVANMKRNGQVENIIVREIETGFFEVVNGNHRLKAMQALKFDKAYVFNVGNISLQAAQRLAIETNETKFASDPVKLGGLLSEIIGEFEINDLILTMPYDELEINNYMSMNEFDWDKELEKNTDNTEPLPSEDFESIRIPESLVELFNSQMERARNHLIAHRQAEVTDDVSPFELILATFAGAPDADIKSTLTGEGGSDRHSDELTHENAPL